MSLTHVRRLCVSSCHFKETPTNLKGKSTSSQNWIVRQLRDPYVEKAKQANYRCRSAFKLLEMDSRFQFLQPGMSVVDCGAAPGSWTQVSVAKVNAHGKDPSKTKGSVVAIDRLPIYPIEGATIISSCDFTLPQSQKRLLDHVGDGVDVVLSDMAPNATGIKTMDHEMIVKLAYAVTRFTFGVGKVGSCLLVKLWEGSETCRLEKDLSNFYKSVKRVKPPSSRSDSAEIFIFAQHFLGTKKS